ncbi:MAG TPA: hypothetical protein VHC44_02800 [Verrucomicrobiae bacterium]|nr:hypothetical protein [Verrucomicrobiae bacterium]
MNPDSENFDSLRQLLALKRHEIPPPGYFDRFSRDVMARIKAGDTGDEIGATRSLFSRFLRVFDVKPIFAGAFGTAVCAFLVSSVISSEPTGAAVAANTSDGAVPIPVGNSDFASNEPNTSSNSMASGSLFQQFQDIQQLRTAPVNDRFYLTGGN